MTETVTKELQDRLAYQRAIYRIHDTDDPALREYYGEFIKNYEKAHSEKNPLHFRAYGQQFPVIVKTFER